MIIPFSPPRIDEKIINEVSNTLRSGWITSGPKVKLFERKLADYCNVANVLAVSSWTAGAELLLYWYGVKEGDEVIIPVYTYCATANIVMHRGAKIIMVDVSSDFGIDISKIESKITRKTKVIISVDIGGFPVNYSQINSIIKKTEVIKLFRPNSENQKKLGRILFVSDAAHSFGASYRGSKVGSHADFTVFSFHAVKNLTTAEGGAICVNLPNPFSNNDIYKHLNILTLHGQNKSALDKTKKMNWEYDVIDAGFKCNMTDVLASIGLVELERYEVETLPKRKEIFKRYTNELKKYSWAITPVIKDNDRETSYHLYMLRVKNISTEERNDIVQNIFDAGVSVNVHYKPLPMLSYYRSSGFLMSDYPIADAMWQSEISLPIYYELTFEQIEIIVNAVVTAVTNLKK